MTKSNPLFIDSTKFHGDLIATQIELRGILLYDGESVYVSITNHQGVTRRIAMKPMDDERSYEAKIHLNHQTLIQYRFVIEKDGVNMLYSQAYKGRAQYAVIEMWQPTEEDAAEIPAEGSSLPAAVVTANPMANPNWPAESAKGIRTLIDKWGF